MPRKPIDFSKTIIYKIVCKDLLVTQCYVGHTTDFTKRKNTHKSHCNIRENSGWDNWDMIEIEKYPCLDVNEAHKRERYWIETLNAELNKVIPTRTIKEYYETHKEYYKNYYEENKEQILEQSKIYNDEHKEQFIEIQKKYYNKHKEKIQERQKLYKENNRDKINKKRRERYALKKQQSAKECV